MMNIYFYGAGKCGKEAIEKFHKYKSDMRVAGFLDSNKTGMYCGYAIVSQTELNSNDIVIISVDRSYVVRDIYLQLRMKDIDNIYWFQSGRRKSYGRENFLDEECVDCRQWGKWILPQVEMHICDYCNLNCKGCAHFSPLFERKMPDLEKRIQDIKLLRQKFSHIIKFYLLGGEPFLNPEIKEYVVEVRRLLPDTVIQIVTNGLLLLSVADDVLDEIRKNDIIISISVYLPTHKILKQIVQRLEERNVRYITRPYDDKQKFTKPLSAKQNSRYPHKCISEGCLNVFEGRISRCPTLMYIYKFNEIFDEHFPNEGILDLQSASAEDILKMTEEKVPLCRHCVDNIIDWECCSNEVDFDDFAVRD